MRAIASLKSLLAPMIERTAKSGMEAFRSLIFSVVESIECAESGLSSYLCNFLNSVSKIGSMGGCFFVCCWRKGDGCVFCGLSG